MKSNRSSVPPGGSITPRRNWISRKPVFGGLIFVLALFFQIQAIAQVGKQGTIFLEPSIIADTDPSTFAGLADAGEGEREIYDRRIEKPYYVTKRVRLFRARFDDMRKTIEVQVNPEFDAPSAMAAAKKYLQVIGQIPFALRDGLDTVTINKGNKPFAGGDRGIVIHAGKGDEYISDGILAETIIHEATHAVLQDYSQSKDWIDAQEKDGKFISDYARQRPEYEDVAESFLMYIAVRYRGNRISARTKKAVEEIMPNRLDFFDGLNLNVRPIR